MLHLDEKAVNKCTLSLKIHKNAHEMHKKAIHK